MKMRATTPAVKMPMVDRYRLAPYSLRLRGVMTSSTHPRPMMVQTRLGSVGSKPGSLSPNAGTHARTNHEVTTKAVPPRKQITPKSKRLSACLRVRNRARMNGATVSSATAGPKIDKNLLKLPAPGRKRWIRIRITSAAASQLLRSNRRTRGFSENFSESTTAPAKIPIATPASMSLGKWNPLTTRTAPTVTTPANATGLMAGKAEAIGTRNAVKVATSPLGKDFLLLPSGRGRWITSFIGSTMRPVRSMAMHAQTATCFLR